DLPPPQAPDGEVLVQEDRTAAAEALTRLSDRDRATLLAHEVSGQDTRSLAAELGSTAGAVAAQLNRARARLRVEYLLARDPIEPPTDPCRPVRLALSGAAAPKRTRRRARLRVEYLLARDHIEPPTDRCRPVLLALSGGDRRRQREGDASRHLLEWDLCA